MCQFFYLCPIVSTVYYMIHIGLQAGCGTGTATLEAKLPHQLVAMKEEVLYMIFLYLYKAYESLERDRCL